MTRFRMTNISTGNVLVIEALTEAADLLKFAAELIEDDASVGETLSIPVALAQALQGRSEAELVSIWSIIHTLHTQLHAQFAVKEAEAKYTYPYHLKPLDETTKPWLYARELYQLGAIFFFSLNNARFFEFEYEPGKGEGGKPTMMELLQEPFDTFQDMTDTDIPNLLAVLDVARDAWAERLYEWRACSEEAREAKAKAALKYAEVAERGAKAATEIAEEARQEAATARQEAQPTSTTSTTPTRPQRLTQRPTPSVTDILVGNAAE